MIKADEALALVLKLAEAEYGPLGNIQFRMIKLSETIPPGTDYNWDLLYLPALPDVYIPERANVIQRALEQVRETNPFVSW